MNNLTAFILRPFQFEGTKMHANVLLMCKLLVLLLITHHIFFKIADPFIPFIPALDIFNTYPNVFNYTLKALLIVSTFSLFFNIKVRTASIIIGLVVILNILGSKPLFFNHTFICGCALILAGLSNNKQPPYLLILQLSLVYFGASINKFLDADWWSGAFMDTWLGSGRENPVYLYVSELLPNMVLAKLLSYIGMFTEFVIATLILFKKSRRLTIWFIIIFHTTLFTLTSFRFGHFLESLVIILLAFLNLPKKKLIISYKAESLKLVRQFFKILDVDKKQIWTPMPVENSNWLSLKTEDKTLYNHKALRDILLYTPNFFILLMILDIAIYILLYNHRITLFIANVIFVWCLILYFFPFNWSRKKTISS
jgi:hypothetical protein